jgi:hypothetical protein
VSEASDNLRCKYPEFADTSVYPDETVDKFLAWALAELDPETWDCHITAGSCALAAHLMAVAKKSSQAANAPFPAAAGGVSKLKTDQEEITFSAVGAATASGDEASYRTTPYGLEYLRLRERVVAGPLYVC